MLTKYDATEALKAYGHIEIIDSAIGRVYAAQATPWNELSLSCELWKITPGARAIPFNGSHLNDHERAGFITDILEFELKRLKRRRDAWCDWLKEHDFEIPPLPSKPVK